MELVPLLCLFVLSCSGSSSAAEAEPRINRKEGTDVTLSCTIPVDPRRPTYKRFVWKKDGQKEVYVYDGGFVSGKDDLFKDRVSFPGELEEGSASITITNTKVADTGNYTCESGPDHKQEVQIYLRVGTASKPSISTLGVATNWALLRCEVNGELIEPVVQWKDSKGENISNKASDVSEDGGKYTVVLETEVTKSGNYSCEATQEEISHQIAHSTYVSVPGPETPTGYSKEHVVGIGFGIAVGFLLLGVGIGCGCKKRRKSK